MRCCSKTTLLPVALGLFILAPQASAIVVDLTAYDSSGDIGDAHFVQNAIGAGTGLIEPFLRVQKNNAEKGVNSDGPYTMDEKAGPWTHSTRISDFGVTELNGVASIRFLLDINENNNEELLSLDQLRVYVAPVGKYSTLEELDANATLIYDMGVGNKILLNFDLEAGSGESDMTAYLPYHLFIPYEDHYLYLFCEFGATGGVYSSDDGFEEWATAGDPPVIGACCFEDEHCEVLPEVDCGTRGGTYQGGMTSCDPNPCAQPTGACCFPDGSCAVATEEDCSAQGGSYYGDSTLCDPNPCTQPSGACCLPDETCIVVTEEECAAQGGTYYGDGSECEPNSCHTVPTLERTWGQVKNSFRR